MLPLNMGILVRHNLLISTTGSTGGLTFVITVSHHQGESW